MLGQKGRVAVKVKQCGSPSVVVFHCPAHRLQLAILDIAEKVCTPQIELILGQVHTRYRTGA